MSDCKQCEELRADRDRLAAENRQLKASLPFHNDRDKNKANNALGKVMRHKTGLDASIGVVEVTQARDALVQAYANANTLAAENMHLRSAFELALDRLNVYLPREITGWKDAMVEARAALAGGEGDE